MDGWVGALRQRMLVRLMKARAARASRARVGDVEVTVRPGVCHPAPFGGISFGPLFERALEGALEGAAVLDVGTGSGVWALLAARAGARVTATDLAHVDLAPLAVSARRMGLEPPRVRVGDLFAPVAGERFDRVLFNPPFHLGEPADDAERAYLGGPHGEVTRRFLRQVGGHLTERGRAYLILPRRERAAYADALDPHHVRELSSIWRPVLGRVYLLEIS